MAFPLLDIWNIMKYVHLTKWLLLWRLHIFNWRRNSWISFHLQAHKKCFESLNSRNVFFSFAALTLPIFVLLYIHKTDIPTYSVVCILTEKVFRKSKMRTFTWDKGGGLYMFLVTRTLIAEWCEFYALTRKRNQYPEHMWQYYNWENICTPQLWPVILTYKGLQCLGLVWWVWDEWRYCFLKIAQQLFLICMQIGIE